MVEMSETSDIIQTATDKSLVILDERAFNYLIKSRTALNFFSSW